MIEIIVRTLYLLKLNTFFFIYYFITKKIHIVSFFLCRAMYIYIYLFIYFWSLIIFWYLLAKNNKTTTWNQNNLGFLPICQITAFSSANNN